MVGKDDILGVRNEEKNHDEFIKRINELIKRDKNKIRYAYYGDTLMRALQTVLSPFMGRTFTEMGGYLSSNFAGSYLRERNQIANVQVATRLAPAISNDLIREVYKMPEVEIDAHNSSFFSQ